MVKDIKWIKKGLIYSKHAQLPTVQAMGDLLRIYYSRRDNKNRSQVYYFDVEADDPSKIVNDPEHPVLRLGRRGCFDDAGVMPSCVVNLEGQIRLYYTGWNVDKGDVPYGHGIGLAIWYETDGEFCRLSEGPILDRCMEIPFLANSPTVMKMPSWGKGSPWKMWFCNGIGWEKEFAQYAICCAESDDGIRWKSFPYDYESSAYLGGYGYACSRPCAYLGDDNDIWIWYSRKSIASPYYISGAYSYEQWITKFNPPFWTHTGGINLLSDEGWDSEMQCYPYIHKHGSRTYMFYNGNGYGASGIGWAEMQ